MKINQELQAIKRYYSQEAYKDVQQRLDQSIQQKQMAGVLGWCVLLAASILAWFLIFGAVAHADSIPAEQAVRAIIGEASNQGYEGMLAVACAIRNRGTLQGVYGVKAKHVNKQPEWVWKLARKAWANSVNCDVTKGATHWENIKAFGKPYWVKSMVKTYACKDHVFYARAK